MRLLQTRRYILLPPVVQFLQRRSSLTPNAHNARYQPIIPHDFIILFRFSFLFNLSTRFRCIVSASFSYRAFSSFAARLSFRAVIRFYMESVFHSFSCQAFSIVTDLSLCFFLLLHLLFLRLHGSHGFSFLRSLLVCAISGLRSKGTSRSMPLLACSLALVFVSTTQC
jgi:hypothetical protein